MTDSVDRILDVIDAGLQTPVPDPTFGEVSPKNHGRCARCQHHDPAEARGETVTLPSLLGSTSGTRARSTAECIEPKSGNRWGRP